MTQAELVVEKGITMGIIADLAIHGGKPVRDKMLPYAHQDISEADIAAVVEALKGDTITRGQTVERFERAVADYCGAKYAVAMSSGTTALHAACAVAGIQREDLVIIPTLTFAATANAAVYCGGRPHFVDIRSDTLCIDPDKIERLIWSNTKAIIPVDFAGHPADYDSINEIAKRHKLVVIADACHSLGAEYKGRKVGTLADMTCFSFHPAKVITTGEGGMVVTDNIQYAQYLRQVRNHGIVRFTEWQYGIWSLGYNYWMTDFAAALGLSQMGRIEEFLNRRYNIVETYDELLNGIPGLCFIEMPMYAEYIKGCLSAFHIYIIKLKLEELMVDRNTILQVLRDEGIGATVHYRPLHLHPYYQQRFGYKASDFPVAEAYYERAITLPCFPAMTDQDVRDVVEAVRKVIGYYRREEKDE